MAAKTNRYYKLSQAADQDLSEIFDYTEEEHSSNQAIRYLTALENVFLKLAANPNLGRERIEIKRGIYSLTEQQHTIFYQIRKDAVYIVRVLHGTRDLPNFL